ncbi:MULTISPECIES: GDSL-type esterase/lipase family protein [Sphingomonas]|uniref:SGNH/GDSL hydrolase family protein n=1 Tax=Sphingomonas molluscorum TaxID=418184 RepID=A0ABU8Q5Z2_9SPHN|nr:hypothetical protein [Sphingomonas sp. JUb134]
MKENKQRDRNVIRVAFWGDSWAERVDVPEAFKDIVGSALEISGHGWISVNSDYRSGKRPPVYNLDRVAFTKLPRASMSNNAGLGSDGWVTVDHGGLVPGAEYSSFGAAADGFNIFTTRSDATVRIGNLRTQTLQIFYRDTLGSFRYRVDGGPWAAMKGSGTDAIRSVAIAGLADGIHDLEVDTKGNTGTVVVYGFYATRDVKGLEVSKIGNGGATSVDLAQMAEFGAPYWSRLLPHIIFLLVGTNDAAHLISKAKFKANLQIAMNRIWRVSPHTIFVLVPSPENSAAARSTALAPYTEAAYELATAPENARRTEFYNARAAMGPREPRLWDDAKHLNPSGARTLNRGLIDTLLWGMDL